MKILMIDKNFMIDRRILLEAGSLTKSGHSVVLCTQDGPVGSGVTVIPDLTVLRVSSFTIKLFENKSHGFFELEYKRFLDVRKKFVSVLGLKLSSLLSIFIVPAYSPFLVQNSNLSPFLKRLLHLLICLRCGDWKMLFTFFHVSYLDLKAFLVSGLNTDDILDSWEHRIVRIFKENKFDAVHVHDLPTLKVGVYLKKNYRVPLVYDAHELYGYQPNINAIDSRKLIKLEGRLIRFVDYSVLINEEQAVVMRRDYGDFPYITLTNATNIPETFNINEIYHTIRDKLGIQDSLPIVLFQGGVNKFRKIDLLLEGIKLASNKVHMVFLTWGSEIEFYKDLSRKLEIQERVHFYGPIPWEEVIFWAASADIGFMPYQALDMNTKLSSPNKMYEFIMAGTPMIGSNELINVHKTLTENDFGLTTKLSIGQDYADAIDEFLSSGKAANYKKNLKENFMKFSWENESKKLIELYGNMRAERIN